MGVWLGEEEKGEEEEMGDASTGIGEEMERRWGWNWFVTYLDVMLLLLPRGSCNIHKRMLAGGW